MILPKVVQLLNGGISVDTYICPNPNFKIFSWDHTTVASRFTSQQLGHLPPPTHHHRLSVALCILKQMPSNLNSLPCNRRRSHESWWRVTLLCLWLLPSIHSCLWTWIVPALLLSLHFTWQWKRKVALGLIAWNAGSSPFNFVLLSRRRLSSCKRFSCTSLSEPKYLHSHTPVAGNFAEVEFVIKNPPWLR